MACNRFHHAENKFHFQQHVYCTLRTWNFLDRCFFSFFSSRFQYQISQIKTYHIRELEFINTNMCLKTFFKCAIVTDLQNFQVLKTKLKSAWKIWILPEGLYSSSIYVIFFTFDQRIINKWSKNTLDLFGTKKSKQYYFSIYESTRIFLICK